MQEQIVLRSLDTQRQRYYVDFDIGMGKGTGYFRQIEKYTGQNQQHFEFLKQLYEENNFLKVFPQETPKIPKVIHQIWIGNRPVPETLQAYQKTWKENNPDWEYKLWTNEEVKEYTFANPGLKFLFDQPLTLGERVDVLRYDILYQYGGIYADCDCICLKPFDLFAHCYDFFVGILQPLFARSKRAVVLQNCLIGTRPKHPIIERISTLLSENWENVDYREDEVYTTVQRTMFSLTDAFLLEGGRGGSVDIAVPPFYFLPIVPYPMLDITIRGAREAVLGIFDKKFAPYSTFNSCSFAHHYSHKEWAKDIVSTMTFKHPGWALLTPKDWIRFLKAKLLHENTQRQKARQTFAQLIAHNNSK
ncbi:MAG: glycosyltransferase family 32 protein [Elainellaceae cyanobacterium]